MILIPETYPDELLYSTYCRYCIRNCENSYKRSMLDLFGSYNNYLNYDLPIKLDFFSNLTKASLGLSTEKIAVNNTLYPFYTAFVDSTKANYILDLMRSSKIKESIRSKAGIHDICVAGTGASTSKYMVLFFLV